MVVVRVSIPSWCAFIVAAIESASVVGCASDAESRDDAKLPDATAREGGGGQVDRLTCDHPTAGASDGLEQCENGMVHRIGASECGEPPFWPTGGIPDGGAAMLGDGCTSDGDCTDMPHGYCFYIERSSPMPSEAYCRYACGSDSDCGDGFLCLCDPSGEPGGTCVPAECATGADCGGAPCLLLNSALSCGTPSSPKFFCGHEGLECTADSQCEPSNACLAGTCTPLQNPCGRPFLVAGAPREAAATSRFDWASEHEVDTRDLGPEQLRTLAAHYTRAGLMEHASIAAFARFVLDLLSLGAPPALVEDAQGALADELRHARLCFGLASRYAGVPVGPARLDTQGALEHRDAGEILETAFLEMCVGETCAAMEAREVALRAKEPVVCATFERIADDETRHAALGWRFVKARLGELAPEQRRAATARLTALAESAMERAGANERRLTYTRADPALTAHGLLPDDVREAVHRAAVFGVVAPCVEVLVTDPSEPVRGTHGYGRLKGAFGFESRRGSAA